jgi:hypothetical protein
MFDSKSVAGIHEALAKCSTLESVKLRACASSYQNDVELEKLIQVIIMMRGLRHVKMLLTTLQFAMADVL